MTQQIISAASAALGGLIVGALEEWRARRRARAADAAHDRRARELVNLAMTGGDHIDT